MAGKRSLTWKQLSMEAAVGAFFFAALVALLVATVVLSREDLMKPKSPRIAVFSDASGLSEGDNVLVQGVVVGRVYRITLDGAQVRVALRLTPTIHIYEGYELGIRYSSVLGGRHVAITIGDPTKKEIPLTQDLAGKAPGDLVNEATNLVQSIKVEFESLRDTLQKEQVIPKIAKFADDISSISGDLRAGKGTIGKLLQDEGAFTRGNEALVSIKTAGDNINGLVADIRGGKGTLGKLATDDTLYTDARTIMGDIKAGKGTLGKLIGDDEVYNNLKVITVDLRTISENMAKGDSTLGRLLTDKGELYLSLRNTMKSAEEIADAMRSGKGTLGKLAMDPTLYEDTRKTILEVRGAVQDFREQAPVSTFGSLVLGAF